jgi:putative transposase
LRVADVRRMRKLEDENKRLKTLVADLSLDKHMLVSFPSQQTS